MDYRIRINGFSALMLWSIPLAMGLAASVWLGFFIRGHYFLQGLSQEQRHADFVGASVRPTGPVKVVIVNETGNNVIVERGDILGTSLTFYYRNTGKGWAENICFTVREKAPDGTVVGTHTYLADNPTLNAGERGEDAFKEIDDDPRIATVEIGMWCD